MSRSACIFIATSATPLQSVIRKIHAYAWALFPHDKVVRLKSPPLASMTLVKYILGQMNQLYEVHDINLFLVYNVHLNRRQTPWLNAQPCRNHDVHFYPEWKAWAKDWIASYKKGTKKARSGLWKVASFCQVLDIVPETPCGVCGSSDKARNIC